jgi:hypothetical protein
MLTAMLLVAAALAELLFAAALATQHGTMLPVVICFCSGFLTLGMAHIAQLMPRPTSTPKPVADLLNTPLSDVIRQYR